ncbi:MAG: hypothetical protein M2R45_02867 [Verrucomicrobia subdivision 3 bacterium]|nr:hypothetical protein [Limisphaerales bacterium]MCS1414719.1 hypothetical protein [Limisphaerales bacterium]
MSSDSILSAKSNIVLIEKEVKNPRLQFTTAPERVSRETGKFCSVAIFRHFGFPEVSVIFQSLIYFMTSLLHLFQHLPLFHLRCINFNDKTRFCRQWNEPVR